MRSNHIKIHFSGRRLLRPVRRYVRCGVGVRSGLSGAHEADQRSGLTESRLVSNSSSFIFGRAHRFTEAVRQLLLVFCKFP